MKRRSFIQTTSAVSLPFFVGGMPLGAVGRNMLSNLINPDNDRVLVLINLTGGNDGLSTLIPMDQYDNLKIARPNLLVPENSVFSLEKDNALHPVMSGLKNVWDDGKLNIIQNVGYPNQNRSHFRSTDIWQTASAADEYLDSGWVGRYFESRFPNYPDGYPNMDYPDPFALTIGNVLSETCQGEASTFSLALVDPANPGTVSLSEAGTAPDNCYGMELDYIRIIAEQTNSYSEVIKVANEKGTNLSNKYTTASLSEKMKIVSRMISGGLQTKVYVINHGGFDLHSNMVEGGDATAGLQTRLLGELSDAICAFQEDLTLMGLEKRVIGMTYSEFGRQIKQNESLGSDHGTAAPLFVFGSCVNPAIIGQNPTIDRQIADQEGVPMQYDFRSVYGTILVDWFGISDGDVRDILFEDFQRLPLIQGCEFTSSTDLDTSTVDVNAYPNPFTDYFKVKAVTDGGRVRISLFDARGAELKVVTDQSLPQGEHEFTIEAHQLPRGSYFVRFSAGSLQKTIKVIKG